MLRVVVTLLYLALTLYTLIECIHTPEGQSQGLPKGAWVLVILFFPLVGPLAWILAGRPGAYLAPRPPGPRGPRGPDDDPDFLRNL